MALQDRGAPVAPVVEGPPHFLRSVEIRVALEESERRRGLAGGGRDLEHAGVAPGDPLLHLDQVSHRHCQHRQAAEAGGNQDPARGTMCLDAGQTDGRQSAARDEGRLLEAVGRRREPATQTVRDETEAHQQQRHPDHERGHQHGGSEAGRDAGLASPHPLPNGQHREEEPAGDAQSASAFARDYDRVKDVPQRESDHSDAQDDFDAFSYGHGFCADGPPSSGSPGPLECVRFFVASAFILSIVFRRANPATTSRSSSA